jgi:hypothetical protein
MNTYRIAFVLVVVAVSSCGGKPPTPAAKIDSPPVDQLSAQQLEAITTACFQYHDLDDPRVAYTHAYCSQVHIERDARAGNALKAQQGKNPWADPNYLKHQKEATSAPTGQPQ